MFEEIEVSSQGFFSELFSKLVGLYFITEMAVKGLRMIMLFKMEFNDECRNIGTEGFR